MGVKAARMQQSRTRVLVADIRRQVAAHEAQQPEHRAKTQRIAAATREARRALRVRDRAELAGRTAEDAAGTAIRRLLDQGVSRSAAADVLEVSRSTVTRLLRLTAHSPAPHPSLCSTDPIDEPAHHSSGTDGDTGTATDGARRSEGTR